MTQLELGPFVLDERIGKGGMGDVWRGRHSVQGSPVAVKVITPRWARESRYADALAREVEACARLTHVGIVSVFDFGAIPYSAASATFGAFQAGSPYFAMEYVDGGSLTYLGRPWPEIKAILEQLLRALAHAHARGVVHRDLKPSNVLMRSSGQPCLTDFGLAHVVDTRRPSADEMSGASGTPRYMAPEQIVGEWREQGPWTDLYALGCLAHGLVLGYPPYEGSVEQVLKSHLDAPTPSVGAAAPPGFDGWLRLMMAKNPRRRFRRAADALWALHNLPDVHDGPVRKGGEGRGAADSLSAVTAPFEARAERPPPEDELRTTGELEFAIPRPPPMPPSFEAHEPSLVPDVLGAGVGIFGMRTIPLVGRRAEREVLWEQLREVHESPGCRAVVLRGEAGTGKSRLAEWVGERASELGAASVLRAVHSPLLGAVDGIGPMISTELRLHGLDAAQTHARIRDSWFEGGMSATDAMWCDVLTRIVLGESATSAGGRARLGSLQRRFAAVLELLRRLASKRPLYVWLDDVQWGAEALALAHYLLQHATSERILLVLTVRDEGLTDEAQVARLAEILGHDATTTVRIGPLPEHQRMTLVRSLLGLDSKAARLVANRAGGNPLFTVQLVGDWIEQQALELGPTGFGLRPDAVLDVPDDIHSVWQRRLGHALGALPTAERDDALKALEIAAALGQDIDETEWRAVVTHAGANWVPRLVATLAAQRLGARTPRGFAFTHGMLRESLERESRSAARWVGWNVACAESLSEGAAPDSWRRIADHFVAAEKWEAALEPLHRAALLGFDLGNYEDGLRSLDQLSNSADQAQLPQDHVWRARAWTLRARLLRERGEIAEAEELLARAEPIARAHGPSLVLAELLGTQASLTTLAGDLARARELVDESLEIWKELSNTAGLGHAYRARNWLLFWTGDYDGARAALEAAKTAYEAGDDKDGLGWVHYEQAAIALHAEDNDEASRLTEVAAQNFRDVGNVVALADCLNMRGEIARGAGELEEAEALYREALAIYEPLGHANALIARENLGLTLLAEGDAAGAETILLDVLEAHSRLGRAPFMMRITAELIECASSLGDLDAWAARFARFDVLAGSTDFADHDTAAALERAGDDRAGQEDPARACMAWVAAVKIWTKLGHVERADALTERVATVSRP